MITSNTALQDGMRDYYLSQAGVSDVNIENKVERESFDYRAYLKERHSKKIHRVRHVYRRVD